MHKILLAVWATLLLSGPAAALEIKDDTGTTLRLAHPARRIVSLAPHVTELLYAAGAGDKLVGAVQYSDYPEAAKGVPRVGGYSSPDLETIVALKPDLVVAWKSGNRSAQLERLTVLGIPVYITEPRRLEDVAASLRALGRLAGSETAAEAAARAFETRRKALASRYGQRPKVRMFYQIWDSPLMTVNGQHLISDALGLCGGENVFADLPQLAPTLSVEAVLAANPEAVLASGMGESRPDWLDQWSRWPGLTAATRGNLFFVPPELIQRHTPRILDGAEQLCSFLEQARAKRPAHR
ncbi:MAG: cobalamin-binding protein [Rhodocyclaceae bacterium]|jgi:iron complex transport system substrate-binding protein|nr:cobalamin-binding protein [Rhodocyclaceae bacterium]